MEMENDNKESRDSQVGVEAENGSVAMTISMVELIQMFVENTKDASG